MSDAKATPRPWALQWSESPSANGSSHIYLVEEATGRKIAAIWGKEQEKQDTGALIVRAVNAHDDLVAALTNVEAVMSIVRPRSDMAEYMAALQQVRAALAKASAPAPAGWSLAKPGAP